MRRLITIILFLIMSSVVWGQGTETFTNIPTSSSTSYSTRSWTGDDGGTWEATDARTDQSIDGKAILVRDGVLTSPTLSGGIGSLTLTTIRVFSGGTGNLQVNVNGNPVGTIPYGASQATNSILNINVSGDFTLTVSTPGNGDRVAMDNLTWTAYSGGAPDPEPTNHVSSFSASANGHNQIDLTWNDNDGAQAAAGFLILANTTGTFSDPVDGTAQSNDTDMSDDEGKVNIISGIEAASFTGLNAETQYFFKIFPFTNSGTDIDYKTDGTVPTDDATTDVSPVLPQNGVIYISEVSDAVSNFNAEFLEIYNDGNDAVDLSNSKIIRYPGAGGSSEYVFDFSTDGSGSITVPSKGFLILARGATQAAFELEWGAIPVGVNYNNGNSNLYFGNGRQWALKDAGTANTDDGTAIDATNQAVANGDRHYQNPIGTWVQDDRANATPGELDAGQVLPVELTNFSALAQSNTVNLTWETATEVNNYGFEIQRIVVGTTHELSLQWEKVGFVEGHGNSNSAKQYSYVDNSVRAGQSYSYRLKQIDFDGQFEYSSVVNVEVGVPMEFSLTQNYPNPFNPSTSIEYSVPSNEFVTLKVYDVLGNTVSTLVNENKEAGKYNVSFDASNLTSGIYFYSINAGGFTQVKKMMLVK